MKVLSEFICDCFTNGLGNGNYIPSLSEHCLFEAYGKFDNYKEIVNEIMNIIIKKMEEVSNAGDNESQNKKLRELLTHSIIIKKEDLTHQVKVFTETLTEPRTLSDKLLMESYILEGNDKKYKTDIKSIDNVFFDILCITFVLKGDTVYRPQNSLYNYEDNTLSYIDIVLNLSGNEEDIKRKIGHELIHAYNDFRLREAKSGTLLDLFDDTYKKSIENSKEDKNAIVQLVANFVKYFKQEEINANIGAFHSAIDNKKFKKIKDGIKLIKKTSIYNDYIILAEEIHKIQDRQYSSDMLKRIYDEFRKNGGYDGKTDNQIIKNLQYKVMKFFRKFNKVIPKMVAEEIEKRES